MHSFIRHWLTLAIMLQLPITAAAAQQSAPAPVIRPVELLFFLHDDIPPAKRASLMEEHIAWFLSDLRALTPRSINVRFIERAPGYTDFNYTSESRQIALDRWYAKVRNYAREQQLPLIRRYKYVLITHERINRNTVGVSSDRGLAAIASVNTKATIAHEMGHMLGATHEDARLRFIDGQECETNVYAIQRPSRASCREYTQENRRRMSAYLKGLP